MTLAEFKTRWANAQKAWNASGSTDHVRIIQLGEDLYFAASDLIDALKDELAGQPTRLGKLSLSRFVEMRRLLINNGVPNIGPESFVIQDHGGASNLPVFRYLSAEEFLELSAAADRLEGSK